MTKNGILCALSEFMGSIHNIGILIFVLALVAGTPASGQEPVQITPTGMGNDFVEQVPDVVQPLTEDPIQAEILSQQNQDVIAETAVPNSTKVGQQFGEALNPGNSALSPETTQKVNEASTQGQAMNGMVDGLVKDKKLLKKDAEELKALMALSMLQGSQQAAGGGSSNPSSKSADTSSSSPATASTYTVAGIDTPVAPSEIAVPLIPSDFMARETGAVSSVSPSSDGVATQSSPVFIVGQSSPNVGFAKIEDLSGTTEQQFESKLQMDEGAKTRATDPNMHSGGTVAGLIKAAPAEGAESDLSSEELTAIVKKIADGKKKTNPPGLKPLTRADIFKPGTESGNSSGAGVSGQASMTEAASDTPLWPDLVDKTRGRFRGFVRGTLGLDFKERGVGRQLASVAGADEEAVLWDTLLVLSILGAFFASWILIGRIFGDKYSPNAAWDLVTKRFRAIAYVVETGADYRMALELRSGKWVVTIRHKKTERIEEVGTPADGAVFSADCLPTSDRQRLGLEHGWETLMYRKNKGFRKTSEAVNPAIRPFPEKIALLQKAGIVRKAS